MRYGFIGLGHLGGQLAGSLLREGFSLTVTDLNRNLAASLLARGAHWADSPKAVAGECDAVITCLPSPAVSEKVLCGRDGILEGLRRGGVWIEMSTLGRDDLLRLAAQAAAKGVGTLEAPVTGGVHRAALLAHQDVTQPVLLEQGVVDRQHGAAGIAEDHVGALVQHGLDHHLGAGHTSACHGSALPRTAIPGGPDRAAPDRL